MSLRRDTTGYAQEHHAFPRERNDCVVRAFSVALRRPYAELHDACSAAGRGYGRKTCDVTVWRVAYKYFLLPWDTRGTVAQFIRANPSGRFYLHRRGHAFCIIDGVVHDWRAGTGARSRITLAYRVPS